jgi:hypothetical protein
MSGKRVCLAGLAVMLLGLQGVRAQEPSYLPPAPSGLGAMAQAPAMPELPGAPPPASAAAGGGAQPYLDLSGNDPDKPDDSNANARKPMSEWLLYPRIPGCCGPIGLNGPIGSEIFLRAGLAFPIGGGVLQHSLQDAGYVEGGARVLFYNPSMDKAWTFTLGVGDMWANSRHVVPSFTLLNVPVHVAVPAAGTPLPPGTPPQLAALVGQVAAGTPITITLPSLTASVASYNQTWLSLYGGREWYLRGCADCSRQEWSWRVGIDVGGRWATEKVDFNEIRHHTGIAGGVSMAGYSEVEIPYQCIIYSFGMRLQYDYLFTHILQSQNATDLQTFDLLFTAGLRF